MITRIALLTALIASIAACSSSSETRRNREASAKFERELRIGLTPEEVSKLSGTKMGNCQGSPLGYQRCTATFWVGSDLSWNGAFDSVGAADYSRDHYRDLVLHFSKGKLERWEEVESARFRANTSPQPH